MERVAGDPKAGADVFFAEERIGGDPAAKLEGQLAGVLHVGLGHEDDEFVSTVARDDVGAAAIGLQNMADALENEVAFEVAVEIVDKLEAVEVHEDEGKGAASTSRALPFGGERFHKEAVRLDAG